MKIKAYITMLLAFLASFGLMANANAAIDLASVTAGFADLTTAITTVGGLILGAAVTAVVFKWLKGMIFS